MAVRIRSRYIGDRDATVGVAIYVGEPPLLLDNCVVEEVAWAWASTSDNGVVTVADAGGGTLTLHDPDRRFDPANDQATDPLTKIGTRVQVIVAGVPAFTGRVDDVAHDLVTCQVALVDDISALASIQFVETAVPAETSSARIGRILDLAAWPAAKRDIAAGGIGLQAGTVAADAWSELVEVNRNELGALWITPAGSVAFRPRATAWGQNPTTQMVFGCPPSDVPLVALSTRGDQSDLVNILSAARRTGTQRTVTDSPSLVAFGRHSHVQNDLEMATDALRDAWQDFYLRRQAQPIRGVGGFACRPGAAAIAKALALPFGAVVQIKDEGHGPPIDRLARWVGTRWAIQPHLVELVAVTGEDASFKPVARSLAIDTPAEWLAAAVPSMVANGSFEQGGTGWNVTGTQITFPVHGFAVDGASIARIAGDGATATPTISTGATAVPMQPLMTYRLRAYGRRIGGTANGFRVALNVRGTGATVFGAVVLDWPVNDPGGYREGYYTTIAGQNSAEVYAQILTGVAPVAEVWALDDITLTPQANVAYREPGVAPANYQGAAGALRGRIVDALDDVTRPTPSEGEADGNP
jgi:hypothetical protein